MDRFKRKRLERAGWKVGTVSDFLGLSSEESALIEMRLALAQSLKEYRTKGALTQEQMAQKLRSSQARVAKMENADASVSLDLLIRSLLKLGASPKELGRTIGKKIMKSAA